MYKSAHFIEDAFNISATGPSGPDRPVQGSSSADETAALWSLVRHGEATGRHGE